MSEDKIIEGNKLIAEFMGRVTIDSKEWVNSNKKLVTEYKYHSSWDWLVPVYNKILAVFNSDKELLSKLRKNALICNCVKTVLDASDVSLQIEISSSFLKVVDIIKWYNSQPK